jgi:hypothetical protein
MVLEIVVSSHLPRIQLIERNLYTGRKGRIQVETL